MALKVAQEVFHDGNADRTTLYRVLDVSTNDTIELGSDFKRIIAVIVMPATVTIPNFPATPTFSGTLVTIAQVSLVNECIWLLVRGSPAS